MEQRLVEIELKVLALEDTVHSLNAQVYEQHRQIEELRGLCRLLISQHREALDTSAPMRATPDERPPHY